MTRVARAAVIALGLAGTGCGSTAGDNPGGYQLHITARDFRFEPRTATVPATSLVTITLTNAGRVEHSFTADSVHGSADADPGEVNTIPFTSPDSGTIAFHCRWHPWMTGTLTVQGSSPSPRW